MADISTFLSNVLPQLDRGIRAFQKSIAVINGSAANGDNIQLYTVPIGASWRLTDCDIRHDATLGAGATLTLRVNRGGVHTALTGATTAGAAGKSTEAGAQAVPFDLQGGDILEATVGGANITAPANVTADFNVTASR